jgi:RNA polymerase sigma-70 factor (family 1)
MEQEEEKLLLRRLQSGDAKAFEIIFERYFRLLFLDAYTRLKSEKEAEDIVQEFFIDFWEKQLFRFVQHSLKYYLYQAVRNRCINKLEHRKVLQRRADKYIFTQAREYYQADRMENNELNNQFQYAMDRIPPESAKVFLLMYIEQLKRKEVARILGISENTVKTQLARALRYLRKQLINLKEQ